MSGTADFYADGQWNFYCDLCGRKEKSSLGRKTWDNFQVCARHKEVRNPQDFVRGIKDDQTVPWSRPQPPDQFVVTCTLRGANAIPYYAIPGCCIPGNINLIFLQEGMPEGPATLQDDSIPHGGNDLFYTFDYVQPTLVRIASTVPGHIGEYFIGVTP